MNLGEWAKRKLEEFVPLIDGRISAYFDRELNLDFGFNRKQRRLVGEILSHGKEYILRKNKRLRSSFVKYGYELGGSELPERLWGAAVGIELVHAALIMHDDIQDEDDLRRGGPTTHKYYGVKFGNAHLGEAMGINIGDALLTMGFEEIAKCGNGEALGQVLRGVVNTGWGQSYDVSLEELGKWTEEDVIVLHRAKTAIYTYENPLFVGAHLAKLPQKAFKILHEYAMDGGVAFQLQDDILGVFGSPEKTGKSADSDLLQGKCTLLVLKVFEDGVEAQKEKVKRVWGKMKASSNELASARQAIIDSGSAEYSRKLAWEYAARAARTASRLRRLGLNPVAIDYIEGIAQFMVERKV